MAPQIWSVSDLSESNSSKSLRPAHERRDSWLRRLAENLHSSRQRAQDVVTQTNCWSAPAFCMVRQQHSADAQQQTILQEARRAFERPSLLSTPPFAPDDPQESLPKELHPHTAPCNELNITSDDEKTPTETPTPATVTHPEHSETGLGLGETLMTSLVGESDLIIISSDQEQVHAHSRLLSSVSNVIKQKIEHNHTNSKPIKIELKYKAATLRLALALIYPGLANQSLAEEDLVDVGLALFELQVEGALQYMHTLITRAS